MKLHTLGSSSSGNCYLLKTETETLILEAGIRIAEIKKELGFNFRNVVGCLVSHKHGDHSVAVSDLQKYGVNIFTHEEVINTARKPISAFSHLIQPDQWHSIGQFRVMAIDLKHSDTDGGECRCYGFIIRHHEMGNLLFATDTVMIPTLVKSLNHIMVEANYADKILQDNIDRGYLSGAEHQRLERSHMEIGTTKCFLEANDLSKVNEIILLHLSSRNSDEEQFKEIIAKSTGKPTFIAHKNLELELNLMPY